MGAFLKWGACGCVLAIGACGTAARDHGEGEQLAERRSALEPVAGPEIFTNTPAPRKQADVGHNPVLASNGVSSGTSFLAVQEVDSQIRAVPVDEHGTVLGSDWLNLGEGTDPQSYPSVAFGAGHYLVIWSVLGAQSTVRGRFVGLGGNLEGSAAFTLSSGQGMYPSVGWSGNQFLVSWLAPGDSASTVTVAAFDATGSKIADSEHVLSTPGSLAYPRIAVGTRRALVTWEKYTHDDATGDIGRIYGALVDLHGAPTGAEFPLSNSASSENTASVAAAGSRFLVVWQTQDDVSRVFGSSLNDNGLFDVKDTAISRSTEPAGLPSVVFGRDQYLVAWTDGRDAQSIYGTGVSVTGDVVGAADVKLASGSPKDVAFGSDRPALAWNGRNYLLSFRGNGIEGSFLSEGLQLLNGQIPLTGVASSQSSPNLAWDGMTYVVQWLDEGNFSPGMTLLADTIGSDGRIRTNPDWARISTPESPAFSASVASNGGYWLSLWIGADGASHWRTVSSDRRVLGSLSPLTELPLSSAPALAGNGTGFLAVYMTGDASNGVVSGRFLPGDNSDTSFPIDISTGNTGPNVFAAAGSGYLVSYSKAGTRLVSVSGAGQVGTSIELSPNVSFVNGATGANTTLVTWTDTSDTQVRARFFAAGAFLGETLVLAESSAGDSPALSWDGSGYFAIWETAQHHLEGRAIASDGALGPVTTLVDEECFGPVSASNQRGQLLVSYVKYDETSRSRRIVSRVVGDRGAGGAGSGESGSSSAGSASGGAGPIGDGSGGVLSTAGRGTASGTAGRGTASGANGNADGSAGVGGNQTPAVSHCSVAHAGGEPSSNSAAIGLGSLLAVLGGVLSRRRRRDSRLRWLAGLS